MMRGKRQKVLNKAIGARLRNARVAQGKSQQVVADFCEITQSALSRHESGEMLLRSDELSKVADFFDLSMDYLAGRTDEKRKF